MSDGASESNEAGTPSIDDRDTEEIALSEIISALQVDDEAPVQRGELARVMRVMVEQHRYYSGPLPSADQLAEYNSMIPDGAHRIMRMAEKEQDHRHTLESTHQEIVSRVAGYEHNVTMRGQTYGAVVASAVLLTGIAFLLAGHAVTGGTIITADVVALAAVFVVGRSTANNDSVDTTTVAEEGVLDSAD